MTTPDSTPPPSSWIVKRRVLAAISASALLSATEAAVLRQIEEHTDNITRDAYPGIDLLAWELKMDARTVERAIVSAKKKGWLRWRPRASAYGTNVYRITPVDGDTRPKPSERRGEAPASSSRGGRPELPTLPDPDRAPGSTTPDPVTLPILDPSPPDPVPGNLLRGTTDPIPTTTPTRAPEHARTRESKPETQPPPPPPPTDPSPGTTGRPGVRLAAPSPIELVDATDCAAVLRMIRSYPIFVRAAAADTIAKPGTLGRIADDFASRVIATGVPSAIACEAVSSSARRLESDALTQNEPPQMITVARVLRKHFDVAVTGWKSRPQAAPAPSPSRPSSPGGAAPPPHTPARPTPGAPAAPPSEDGAMVLRLFGVAWTTAVREPYSASRADANAAERFAAEARDKAVAAHDAFTAEGYVRHCLAIAFADQSLARKRFPLALIVASLGTYSVPRGRPAPPPPPPAHEDPHGVRPVQPTPAEMAQMRAEAEAKAKRGDFARVVRRVVKDGPKPPPLPPFAAPVLAPMPDHDGDSIASILAENLAEMDRP